MCEFFAARVRRIKHSPSNAAGQMVREMVAQCRDFVGLTIGDPDFATAHNVQRAAVEAMARDDTHYATVDGTDELTEAVRLKYRLDNRLEYSRKEVTIGTAPNHIVFNAIMATVSERDEVLTP